MQDGVHDMRLLNTFAIANAQGQKLIKHLSYKFINKNNHDRIKITNFLGKKL